MAPPAPSKINKDISSRKTARSTAMDFQAKREMDAVRAAHEAYVESLKNGYEAQLEAQEQEHEDQISALTAEREADTTAGESKMAQLKESLFAKEKTMKTEAEARAKSHVSADLAKTKKDLKESTANYAEAIVCVKDLEERLTSANEAARVTAAQAKTLQHELAESHKSLERMKSQLGRASARVEAIKNASAEKFAKHDTGFAAYKVRKEAEIRAIRVQNGADPDPWMEIKFAKKQGTGSGRAVGFVRRRSTGLKELFGAATKNSKWPVASFEFEVGGRKLTGGSMTLSEVCLGLC